METSHLHYLGSCFGLPPPLPCWNGAEYKDCSDTSVSEAEKIEECEDRCADARNFIDQKRATWWFTVHSLETVVFNPCVKSVRFTVKSNHDESSVRGCCCWALELYGVKQDVTECMHPIRRLVSQPPDSAGSDLLHCVSCCSEDGEMMWVSSSSSDSILVQMFLILVRTSH